MKPFRLRLYASAYWWPQSKWRQIEKESDEKVKTKHINGEIQEEDCRKAKSSSLMQTSIFSIFNLHLHQKIKFSLRFEVRNESHKEFLGSFLGEWLSIALRLRGLLDAVCTWPVSERATDWERASGRKYEAAKQTFCLPYNFFGVYILLLAGMKISIIKEVPLSRRFSKGQTMLFQCMMLLIC